MAEYIVKGESLTAIADKIRVLSGTEEDMGLDAMENHVGEANTDVATEAGLIAQIASALEGKTAGGSGDDGDVNIDTCSVALQITPGSWAISTNIDIFYNIYTNGKIDMFEQHISYTDEAIRITIDNVVCKSFFLLDDPTGMLNGDSDNTTATLVANGTPIVYCVPAMAGGTCAISINLG